MVWFLFALFGALFDSLFYMLSKRLLRNTDQYVLAGGVFLSSFVVLLAVSLYIGIPGIGQGFYASVLVTAVLNVIAAVLYYRALRITDLSLSIPMISFTPVFLILTSFILLGESPSSLGIAGILLIVAGSYILNSSGKSTGLIDTFRNITGNRGILYMLAVAFLFSISANFDKLVVKNSDPYFGHSMVFLVIGASFLVISWVRKSGSQVSYYRNFPGFFIVGSVLALEAIAINIAYTMQIVPYVISVKRTSILFGVLFGGLVFREKNIHIKVLGAVVMLTGAVFIIIFENH
ncbi:MAG: DMT family transporter [Candidatus Methanoperedens sp.]|nr:DMT family transporter [Candidatus Methanoperedens sp.]